MFGKCQSDLRLVVRDFSAPAHRHFSTTCANVDPELLLLVAFKQDRRQERLSGYLAALGCDVFRSRVLRTHLCSNTGRPGSQEPVGLQIGSRIPHRCVFGGPCFSSNWPRNYRLTMPWLGARNDFRAALLGA